MLWILGAIAISLIFTIISFVEGRKIPGGICNSCLRYNPVSYLKGCNYCHTLAERTNEKRSISILFGVSNYEPKSNEMLLENPNVESRETQIDFNRVIIGEDFDPNLLERFLTFSINTPSMFDRSYMSVRIEAKVIPALLLNKIKATFPKASVYPQKT